MSLELGTKNIKQSELVWKAFVQGKKWAFTKIYEEHYNDLYNYGIKFIPEHDITKDLIHDLFLKLWKNRNNISKPNNIKAYLHKGIRSIILDYIKVYKKKYQETDLINNVSFNTLSSEDDYIAKQSIENSTKQLNKELEKLPARQKEAIYLHYIKEYTYQEVSTIMSLNLQSVRNLVYEGLIRLKQKKSSFL